MIYFDNGATTFPKPRAVVNAVDKTLRYYSANPGRSGHNMSLKASEIMYECRKNAAELFNADSPEKIIFTYNCTAALNYVIKGLLKEGDHAVISSLEHNAVLRPLESLKENGVEYSIADYSPNDEETINNFRNAIRPNTKLVVCTHASNVFGVRLPVERIAALCRIHGVLFCVDAAQTAGVVPISLKDSCIDFLCTAGHKGLYGPMGTGILVINSETLPESLIQGGTGSFSSERKQPAILPDRYESGTPNLPGIAGLNEGIKFVMNRTERNIESYESELAVRLYHKLKNIPGVVLYTDSPETHRCVPVISFNIEGLDSEETSEILNKRFNIAVRAGLHCAPLAHEFFGTQNSGTVRAVLSVFSNYEQVDYFISSIRTINKFKKELKKVAIDI